MNEIVEDLKKIDSLLQSTIAKLSKNADEKPSGAKAIELVDVRKVFVELSRSGKTEQIKNLIKSFGANKLSEVDPAKYGDLLKEAEKLNG